MLHANPICFASLCSHSILNVKCLKTGWSSPCVPAVAYLLHIYLSLSEDVWCFVFHFLLNLNRFPTFPSHSKRPAVVEKKMSKNGKLNKVLKILLSDGFPAKPARVTLLWVVSQQLGIIFMAYGLTGSPSTVFSWFVPGTLRTISALLCRNSDVGLYDSGSLACDKYNFFSFPSL